jgi:hypothetical protein
MSTDTRIESLETQVRTLKRMLFGVFGLVVVGGLLAATSLQSVPDFIQAKRFEVVNGEGKIQAMLYANPDGGALGVFNKVGKASALVSAEAFGGMLGILNKDGKSVIAMTADADGDGMMITRDSKGVETSRSP